MITIFNLLGGFGGGQSQQINDVLFDIGPIYRNDTALSLNAYPVGVTLLQSRWEIRDMETNALVGASFKNLASIPVTVEGFHKIIFVGQTTEDQYSRQWDDVLILNRKFTEAEADVVVDLSTASGGYYTDFASADNSGLKIYVKGVGASVPYFAPTNLWGTSGGATKFANYVRIQKEVGNTDISMTANGGQPNLSMSGARYILVDGHNDDGTAGWNVICGSSGQFNVRLDPGTPFTNVVYTGLKLDRTGTHVDVAGFSLIGPYNQTYNAVTWQVLGMAIHHCQVRNSGAEGMYWQFTDDRIFSGAPDYQPSKMIGMICAWNTLEDCGNDGIQPCNSLQHRIHDNTIDTCGVQLSQYHECGISYNAGCSGKIYNNYIINVKVFITLDSGLTPVDLYAGSTTPQKSQFYNNVMINGTPPSGGVTETIAIYGQLKTGSLGTAVLPWEFFNNTFICSKQLAAFYFNSGGFTMPTFKFFNNLITKQTNASGTYPEVEFIGPGTKPTSPVVNNLVYQNGSEGPALFIGGGNYRPSSLLSTAFTGSPTDVSATISGIDFNDADGLFMGDYFGAYSRSDLKTITPVIVDPVAATLTSAVAVGSITASGGTITFEANKVGILFWGVVANGATAPTVAQLMAGTGFLSSGYINDFGTAGTGTISGLPTPSTAYDLYSTFVTLDWVPTTVVKTDFSTIADVIAPVLSGWEVRNAYPNRLYFASDEIITGTTYGGFTLSDILGTIPTVTGITINTGQLTDHYFTLSADITAADYLGKVAYSGSGSNIVDASSNALASFAATLIDNNITYAVKIKVNITNSGVNVAGTEWNNSSTPSAAVQTLTANLDDDTNTPTGYAFEISEAFHALANAVNATAGVYITETNALARGLEVYNATNNSGTLRFSGLTSGKAFDLIYIIKNTFGTGAGNVNVNGAGSVGYTTGTVERKVSGTVNGSGYIDWVITQTNSNTSECIAAMILIVYP